MGEFYDENGNPVEAYTPEEVEEKVEELKEELKEEVKEEVENEFKEETEKLKTQIEEKDKMIKSLEEDLTKVGDKNYNFKSLREKLEKTEQEKKELEEKLASVDKKIEEKVNALKGELTQKEINDEIKKLAGGDEELEKKIRYHLENFKEPAETDPDKRREQVKKQIESAFILATGGKKPESVLDKAGVSGVSSPFVPKASKGTSSSVKDVSEEAKELGKKRFGLTDEDFQAAENALSP